MFWAVAVSESDATDSDDCREDALTSIARGMGSRHHSDLFFIDTDQDPSGYEVDDFTSVQNTEVSLCTTS